MEENGKSNCPICNKEFSFDQIESHVDKCLFLNSDCEAPVKRLADGDITLTPSSKKSKRNDPTSSKESIESLSSGRQVHRKPLAEVMRPTSLSNFVGQEQILEENSLFRSLIEQNNIPSMILWGPPGCGKTTLAHIIHKTCMEKKAEVHFTKLSACMAGVNDVKAVIQVAKNEMTSFKRRTILFMDEIHRFNKLQQDIFLPHVENGTITLIGATTENPSFSLNSALLSRCRVFILEKLKSENITTILERAAKEIGVKVIEKYTRKNKFNNFDENYVIEQGTLDWLAGVSDGDARIALNSLQLTVDACEGQSPPNFISIENIKDGIKRSHLLYDKKGDEHYNTISALHKSIRASDDNAALYWLTRMLEGGEDPMFIARRLVRAASEDVGLSDPMALTLAVSAMHGCQLIGKPECDVLLAQVATYLARTHKSREVYHALLRAKNSIKSHKGPLPSVPLHLRNAPTKLMKDLGYGKGYNTLEKDQSGLEYMPEGMEGTNFFLDA